MRPLLPRKTGKCFLKWTLKMRDVKNSKREGGTRVFEGQEVMKMKTIAVGGGDNDDELVVMTIMINSINDKDFLVSFQNLLSDLDSIALLITA